MRPLTTKARSARALVLVLAATVVAYAAGLSGPFLFDDTTNILQNQPLRIESLAPGELWRAAWSLESGPLKRPVAYLSFALNHYFAGGYSALAFKATNLAIHLLNVLLVGALALRLGRAVWPAGPDRRHALAWLAAALFALHPLALSPVLYAVQRMASLSTLFVLAALLCLLRARDIWGSAAFADPGRGSPDRTPAPSGNSPAVGREIPDSAALHPGYTAGQAPALWRARLWLAGAAVLAVLGVFTKENAALLPLLYVLCDRVCYPDAPYWRWLRRPGTGGTITRAAMWAVALAATALLAWYVAPGYAARPFTLMERQLTEARVLWFYLGLFALPRVNAFGLYHDDIAISTGLLTPWTTLPALIGIAALVWAGFRLLGRAPLAGFAVLWFFAAHLMESTLIPLEIAHEHRNYLPMVGLCVGAAWLLVRAAERMPRRTALAGGLALLAVLGGTTALRAWEWGEADRFYRYQVEHHPNSAHSHNDYASELGKRRRYTEALEHLRGAQRVAPHEAGYYFNYYLTARAAGLPVPDEVRSELEALLRTRPLSAFGLRALQTQGECLRSACAFMAADIAQWIETHLAAGQQYQDESQLHHLLGIALVQLGRPLDAVNAFERAFSLDRRYLHPLFEQANVFMALRQWDNAAFDLERIREANKRTWVRRDREIAQLEAAIARGRREAATGPES